jgi:hypothetical protein
MTANPRIFIVDFDLVGYSGHSFNQVLGFCEAARERGLKSYVYTCRSTDQEIAKELSAHTILPSMPWLVSKDAVLEAALGARHALKPLWDEVEGAGISRQDILVVTSSRAQVIVGVGQWIAALPEQMRPAVFFRFFRTDFFDFHSMLFSTVAWAYYFAARMLAAFPGRERIFLTVNNRRAVEHLDRLTLRPSFFLPVPKYYGDVVDRPEARTGGPATIYVHINRPDFAPELVGRVVAAILKNRTDVRFMIRLCGYAFPTRAAQESAARSFSEHNVELIPGNQSPVEYLAAIDQADIVLLPYDPVEYHDIVSGIFCEAVAMGKVAIVPAETWMADHITDVRAAGVLFQKRNVDDVVAAVREGLQDFTRLQEQAHQLSASFRHENSCASNLDRMIELAAQSHDMRLSYVPLTDATKALGSQHHFGEGWSPVDEGFGIWSDGERAEINFSIASGASSLVFSALVHPFLTKEHSRLDVSLALNGAPVAEWSFDRERPQDRGWSWRHVQLPEDLTASGEIQIVFSIRSPVSPHELGLSIDRRKLGIALRTFSLGPDRPEPDVPKISKSSKLKQWARHWLKPH